jgi:exopolysaccharide biosynthesis protein
MTVFSKAFEENGGLRTGSDAQEKLNREGSVPLRRPGQPRRRRRSARSRIRLAYALFLVLFTIFVLLDTFLIPRNIVRAGRKTGRLSGGGQAVVTEDSYEDDNIRISITTRRVENTTVYIADVVLSDPSLLQTGLAGDSFGRNLAEVPSAIAERNGAVFAINGDFFGFREKGYVLRNGYLYRSSSNTRYPYGEDLAIMEDGSFRIIDEAVVTAQELEEEGAQQVFSFGPALVNGGEVRVVEGEEVERAQITNPRTAIGIIEPLHYCMVVSDGRTRESHGLSLYQLADLMQELGCDIAYNLDGGGSSTMWFNGKVMNKPTTYGDVFEERIISDIVYIGY